jgi:hypothetical protein
MNAEQRRRSKIIINLQERICRIENNIKKLTEDKELYEQIIEELQHSKSEDEVLSFGSIEFIQDQNFQVHSREEKLVKKASTKKAERQEGLEKARAWHLNRKKEKQNRKRR